MTAALLLFCIVIIVLMAGYPVAFTLAGTSIAFAAIGVFFGIFDPHFFQALPSRIFGIIVNETLIAVPLFIFMGVMLERSKVSENLINSMADLFGNVKGGLGISVTLVGMLLAASTGIVGATVVTMGLLSLPTMLKKGYDTKIATGTICAAGTLGQIIPPSIVLVLLGDVLSSAYQQAQLNQGIFSPDTVSVGDLFVGAIFPGMMLVGLYLIYIVFTAHMHPEKLPTNNKNNEKIDSKNFLNILGALVPPLFLILAVLGSIIAGFATPTEAASVGAVGALFLAFINRQLSIEKLKEVVQRTTRISCMVFMILIGASIFSLVFRGLEGDEVIYKLLTELPGGVFGSMLAVMLLMFLLGFVLDFIEITFVIVPIVGPVLLMMGVDPVWLGIMIAINLQTSFLTPPFGFALFYLRGVAPPEVKTTQIYQGVMPFIGIQLLTLGILASWPKLATWLPDQIF
ncbi:MAG: TRAP transporter large permease subunit [Pseudomonadota bacterium]